VRLALGTTALALLALAAPGNGAARAQDPPAAPRCVACKSTGRVACRQHEASEMPLEHDVLYCSAVDGCGECGGAGWLPCKDCDNAPAREALGRKRARIGALREGLAKLDAEMGRALRKVETDHFVLVWEIDELKVDKRVLRHHELMHLYASRLERVYAEYVAALAVQPRELREKCRVLVWYFPADQVESSLRFCGNSSPRGVKLMGGSAVYSVCGNKQNFKDDEALHRNLVHSVAHLLFAHQSPSQWIGDIKGGWADEGVAHWFEERFFGLCDNYCYQEQNTTVGFKGGKWKPVVRKMIAMGDLPTAGDVFERNTDTLTPPMHAVAFSYVDFLIAQDGAKFGELGRELRRKAPTRDALKKTFGWTVLQFEERWKAWVLETYPAR
jgi:hypothetical protein